MAKKDCDKERRKFLHLNDASTMIFSLGCEKWNLSPTYKVGVMHEMRMRMSLTPVRIRRMKGRD